MPLIKGLTGLRPDTEWVEQITCPPYDVIKPGTDLETMLKNRENSLFHITLGNEPEKALQRLIENKMVTNDNIPCFYIYEQIYGKNRRYGVLSAIEVSDYKEKKIIRHEKTFDEKVKGRLELMRRTGYSFGPVFLLTKVRIDSLIEEVTKTKKPLYDFETILNDETDLHGIHNKIYRVEEESEWGERLKELLANEPLYIADGHHRYHTTLIDKQDFFMGYICGSAEIQAYNRVINGEINFKDIADRLDLKIIDEFSTPEKHTFNIFTRDNVYSMRVKNIPVGVIESLDASILEQELYKELGLTHDMIMDKKYFDYYPERDLKVMEECVKSGEYDIAVALNPVTIEELMKVADAGATDSCIVMPEKSTFFSPKILSGLFFFKQR